MSNMKIGGRVYRDIEKMNLDGLSEVRRALVQHISAIHRTAITIGRTPQGMARIGKLEAEQQMLLRRVAIVDTHARQLIKKAPVEEVQKYVRDETENMKVLSVLNADMLKEAGVQVTPTEQ